MDEIMKILSDQAFANIMQLFIAFFGSAAFLTYWWQKREQIKTAATLIINQIDDAEYVICLMKEPQNKANDVLCRTPEIIGENYWDKYKVLFIKRFRNSEIEVFEKYYGTICQIQKGKDVVMSALDSFLKWHSLEHNVFQKEMSDLKASGEINLLQQKENATKIFLEEHVTLFQSQIGVAMMEQGLSDFYSIKGTTAYKALEKMSYRRKLS